MDDPIVGLSAPVRLRRTCERNRLEKQFLSNAYECLVALIKHDDQHGAEHEGIATSTDPNIEGDADPSEVREALA